MRGFRTQKKLSSWLTDNRFCKNVLGAQKNSTVHADVFDIWLFNNIDIAVVKKRKKTLVTFSRRYCALRNYLRKENKETFDYLRVSRVRFQRHREF